MKRLMIFTLLAIFAVLSCTAQQQEQREKPRPGHVLAYGPVHVMRWEQVTITTVNGELVEGPRIPLLSITYSEDGTEQEHIFYAPDGSIKYKKTFLYDQKGKTLEATRFNGKGEKQLRVVYIYDNRGRLIEETHYRPDDSVFIRRTYDYPAKGVRESTVYDQNGAIISKNTTKDSFSKGTAEIRQTVVSEINLLDSGKTVKNEQAITHLPNGVLVYEWRQGDRLPERTEHFRIGENVDETLIYNPDGTIKSKERYARELDSHHNVIKTVSSVAEGDSMDFKPVEMTYRTIEYYE
jgi:hypothetical protein